MAEVKSFDESDETRRKDHDSYFYIKGLPELEEDTIDLLANYSHWPSNEIVPLVQRLVRIALSFAAIRAETITPFACRSIS